MRSVEILRDGRVHQVFFPFVGQQVVLSSISLIIVFSFLFLTSKELNDNMKAEIKFEADLSSPGDKIKYFSQKSEV